MTFRLPFRDLGATPARLAELTLTSWHIRSMKAFAVPRSRPSIRPVSARKPLIVMASAQGSNSKKTVGFMGMGIMGVAMARNLIKSGLFEQVIVHNRTLSKVSRPVCVSILS